MIPEILYGKKHVAVGHRLFLKVCRKQVVFIYYIADEILKNTFPLVLGKRNGKPGIKRYLLHAMMPYHKLAGVKMRERVSPVADIEFELMKADGRFDPP